MKIPTFEMEYTHGYVDLYSGIGNLPDLDLNLPEKTSRRSLSDSDSYQRKYVVTVTQTNSEVQKSDEDQEDKESSEEGDKQKDVT